MKLSRVPRVLFVGGCHVDIADYSFPKVALRSISDDKTITPNVLSYSNLRSGSLVVETCRRQKTEILVLQLGHYEASRPMQKAVKDLSRFGPAPRQSSHTPQSVPFVPSSNRSYRPTFHSGFSGFGRIALAAGLTVLGQQKKLFNPGFIGMSLNGILSSLQDLSLQAVLLLSPFSCPDKVVHYYRLQARQIFASAAKEHGAIYVDTFGMLESFGRGKAFWDNFVDSYHLSPLGHERVGKLVGENLLRAIGELQPTAEDSDLEEMNELRLHGNAHF